jgi:phage-related protein
VLKGFGSAGVLEVVANDHGGTYRAVYTIKLKSAVYVLHVFQKKSKRGRGLGDFVRSAPTLSSP